MDINPLSPGHILVIPKTHAEKMHELPDANLTEILPLCKKIVNALHEQGLNYNILQNNGKLAHQAVDHVHFHIIPRRNTKEGLGIEWNTQTVSHEKLAEIATKVKANM
uniref:HIT domain-containing protein n=1 Tax=Arcella intermedia TaxID=1963864 RepID=A0A6B2LQY8_9EUKA